MKANSKPRRGVLLMEMVAAVVVIAVVFSALAWSVSEVLRLRQQLFRAALAQQYLANLLEEIDAWELTETTADKCARVQLPATVAAQLPGAQLLVEIEDPRGDDVSQHHAPRRVEVKLSWNDRSGRPRSFVNCSLWKYPTGGVVRGGLPEQGDEDGGESDEKRVTD